MCTQGNEWAEKISHLEENTTGFVDGSCAAISHQVFPKKRAQRKPEQRAPVLCSVPAVGH